MMRRTICTTCSRRGLALVVVLWVTILMIVLATVTSQSSLLDTHISHVDVERQRCRWACRAGVETAIALLVDDDPGYDCLTDDWGGESEFLADLEFEGCTLEVTVTDTASKLNLNKVSKQQLLYLPDMTEEVADSLLDWRDKDDQIRQSGAEDGYYMNLEVQYRPQNTGFKTTQELLRVRGVSEGLFYGDRERESLSEENEGWANYLTFVSYEANVDISGESKSDINQARERQLQQTLSLTPGQAKWIVENRPFKKYSDVLKQTSSSSGNSKQQPNPQDNRQNQEQPATPPDVNTALKIIDNAALNNNKFYAGRININTVGIVVLTAVLEGHRELAESIVAYRDGLAGGFTGMTDLQDIEGMTQEMLKKLVDLVTVRSSVYEIDCTAFSNATNLKFHVKAIVNREQSEGRIIYWREGSSR
jgi:type II secretory pathway component PulK